MSGSALTGMSALVVDDEEFMLDFLCMAVEKSGVGNVISATSGAEALDQVVASLGDRKLAVSEVRFEKPYAVLFKKMASERFSIHGFESDAHEIAGVKRINIPGVFEFGIFKNFLYSPCSVIEDFKFFIFF